MFIQTEDTPNPATMKFLPSRLVVEKPLDFPDATEAAHAPLALALFAVDGVQGVFLGRDFVSVTKKEGQDWAILRAEILAVLMDHFLKDRPVLESSCEQPEATQTVFAPEDSGVVQQIRELLDNRIRPAVAQDGGDVAFEGYQDGIVYLRLKGACAGCPSATATLRYGIEQMLRHFIPEVQEVRRVM